MRWRIEEGRLRIERFRDREGGEGLKEGRGGGAGTIVEVKASLSGRSGRGIDSGVGGSGN